MDLHGGSISVHSEGEGKGTTFIIKLPVYFDNQSLIPATFAQQLDPPTTSDASLNRMLPGLLAGSGIDHSVYSEEKVMINSQSVLSSEVESWKTLSSRERTEKRVCKRQLPTCDKMSPSKLNINNGNNIYGVDVRNSIHPQQITGHDVLQVSQMIELEEKSDVNLSVLLVDDVALTRKMMRRLLSDRSNAIDEAIDGEQAVEMVRVSIIQDKPYDVVMMDNQMPMMDGPTAAQAMRQLGFTGLILGVTGHTSSEDEEQFLSKGADKVLTKPIDLKELDRIIGRDRVGVFRK